MPLRRSSTRTFLASGQTEVLAISATRSRVGSSLFPVPMEEIMGMADRILVMCEGKKTAEIDIAEATQENIMHAATLR